MHIHTLKQWKHRHRYNVEDGHGERNTRRVIVLTLSMMIFEITAGYLFGSMALLADGWHMGTHAVALSITAFAYYFARRHSDNPSYSFGTGKVGVLGGFASAVVLALIALLMGVESIQRLFSPQPIRFNEAIAVAFVGLAVNVISALLLQEKHDHSHEPGRGSTKNFHDHNLRAAYLHVLADALTSVLAIIALFTGKAFGWVWMDPIMGIVGAVIISRWSYGLLVDTGRVLLDRDVNPERRIRTTACQIFTFGGLAPTICRPSFPLSLIFPKHPTIIKNCWPIIVKSHMLPLRSIHARVNPVWLSRNLHHRC